MKKPCHLTITCQAKIRYPDRAAATAHAPAAAKACGVARLYPYQCEICNGWHHTKTPRLVPPPVAPRAKRPKRRVTPPLPRLRLKDIPIRRLPDRATRTPDAPAFWDEPPPTLAPPPNADDLTGRKFGLFAVIGYLGSGNGGSRWLVRCVCGRYTVRRGPTIRKGCEPDTHCQFCSGAPTRAA